MAPPVTSSVMLDVFPEASRSLRRQCALARGIVGRRRPGIASPGAAMTSDEFEIWFDKGVTDGLPVVPPTRERVERMLAGSGRPRDELLGTMPPNYGRLTVEKAAINAVLAGCRPEYLPVVVAAAESACDPAFNLHGVATSTHFAAPLIVVNGPIRTRIGLNSAFGVFGPGYRANATIGRALRLLMINVGGARPGEISMSTFGHPGRYTYCIAENEEASPWPPFHASRGFPAEVSTVTLFAGEGPHGISVGSRTGAVPAWVRLQPPPHRTAQTDFPYAALLSASRHGLCDLSTRSAFVRSPIADPVVSEEPEPFMEPRRTPPLPAEAAIRLVSLRHDVDPPPQVLQTDGRRDHAAPASRVVGGSAEQQGPFAPRALPRFVATTNPSATLSPSDDFPGPPVIRPT